MLNRTFFFILITAFLALTGCQANPPLEPSRTAALPAETEQAALPARMPIDTPAPAPTATEPLPPLTGAPTALPADASSGSCFAVREALPFAFTPDGNGIALRSMAGVQIVNLETMDEETFLQAPQNVYSAALSPDGETLAWSLEDNSIQLLRVADQSVIATLLDHPDIVFKLRFSPSGDRLYSTSHDSWVRVWDLQGNLVNSFQPAGGEVLGMGISPDGKTLAAIPFDGPVVLWDMAGNQKQADLVSGTGGYDTSDAAFTPDGQYVAADLATGLFVWGIAGGELALDEHPNTMTVAFSPDGRILAYSDLDAGSRVNLLSTEGFQLASSLETNLSGPAWELIFSPDGSKLAVTDGIEVQVWRVAEDELLAVGKGECP
jgi:WD40 repeat protein